MQLRDKPIAGPQIVLREGFDDWPVLFHSLTGAAVGVGAVGLMIWMLWRDRRALAEVTSQVQAQCVGASPTALAGSLAFADTLPGRLLETPKADGGTMKVEG